jgi:hypothetical protein
MHIDFNVDSWLFWLVAWIANVVAGACAGSGKQAAWHGALLGALLGPLGVVAALGLDRRSRCPVCTGRIDGVLRWNDPNVAVRPRQRCICQYCRAPLFMDPVTGNPLPDNSDEFREKSEPGQ